MSEKKKTINPAEYGRWHEITEADTENSISSSRTNRLSLIRNLQSETENSNSIKENTITFNEDISLNGLDSVIKKLKEKARENHEQDAAKSKTINPSSD